MRPSAAAWPLQAALLASAALSVLMAAPAVAHGTFEANELETHLLNDEGTDTMQSYGGYDVNELFLGVAHDPSLGAGAAGDGLYFRLEAYGEPTANAPPTATDPWRLAFTFTTPAGEVQRSIATADGQTFTSDFDALALRAEGVELHVDRAFLLFSGLGVAAGAEVGGFRVESYVGEDLRDVAPGPLCVPGTGCQLTYEDPHALEGRGTLVESMAVPGPEVYFGELRATGALFNYTIEAPSALRAGGQHILLRPVGDSPGWEYTLSPPVAVDANGTATFLLAATGQGPAPLHLELATDVGGRLPVELHPNGTLVVGRLVHVPPAPPPQESPGAVPLAVLGALALAAARRRRALP